MHRQVKPEADDAPERDQIEENAEARELEDCIRRSREWIDKLDKYLSKDPQTRHTKP
jgi:hypothetical protein